MFTSGHEHGSAVVKNSVDRSLNENIYMVGYAEETIEFSIHS